MHNLLRSTAVLMAVLTAAAGAAGDDILVYDAWSRAMPPVARNGVSYMRIANAGTEDDRLVSAESPVADRIELHTSEMVEGVMKMRPIPHVDLPAGGEAVLEPGGPHLMLMGLKEPLEAGKTITLTLRFTHAGPMVIEVPVEKHDQMGGHGGSHGMGGTMGGGVHGAEPGSN